MYRLKKKDMDKLGKSYLVPDFPNAEMVVAVFDTDQKVVKHVLPRPLKPAKEPQGMAFVARYPQTNFGCVYNEGALFLACEFKGERGLYCLSMPVDDDMAMVGGREQFGYPKKIADAITLERDDMSASGSVVRKGTEILKISCTLEGDCPDGIYDLLSYRTEDWDGVPCHKFLVFQFKFFPGPGGGFDYFPRLIREAVLFRPVSARKIGSGELVLGSTPYDPLGDIPVGEVTSLTYGVYHNTMLPGKVVGRVWNPLKFARHAFFKTDSAPTLIENFDPEKTERAKEIYKLAKQF